MVRFENQPKKEVIQVIRTACFVVWICSKFTREKIEEIIQGLSDVLADRNPDVKPKDDFKENYPHREYHFTQEELRHPVPKEKDPSSLFKIHNSLNTLYTLCLVLTFRIYL